MLTLAVLGHHDPYRFARALHSARVAASCASDAVVQAVVDTTGALDCEGAWEVSGGTAGKAKAALLLRWAESAKPDDFIFQLDGDDVFYPCAALAIQRDFASASADLVGYHGFDIPSENRLWAFAAFPPWPAGPGRGEHWDRYPYVTSWMPRLWNEKAARYLKWDVDMPAYEDGMICYRALGQYFEGNLRVCISGAVDILAVDPSTPGSAQKVSDMDYWADVLRARRAEVVHAERSNWGEFARIAPAPMLSADLRLAAWKALQTGV